MLEDEAALEMDAAPAPDAAPVLEEEAALDMDAVPALEDEPALEEEVAPRWRPRPRYRWRPRPRYRWTPCPRLRPRPRRRRRLRRRRRPHRRTRPRRRRGRRPRRRSRPLYSRRRDAPKRRKRSALMTSRRVRASTTSTRTAAARPCVGPCVAAGRGRNLRSGRSHNQPHRRLQGEDDVAELRRKLGTKTGTTNRLTRPVVVRSLQDRHRHPTLSCLCSLATASTARTKTAASGAVFGEQGLSSNAPARTVLLSSTARSRRAHLTATPSC